jgi:phage repressor protein C with HTH and peptisase S24 domain
MKTNLSPTLAERLTSAMKARKLTQVQLAALVSTVSGFPISQVAIQKITSGKTQHSRRIPDIARALGVSPEWLGYGDSPFPESGSTFTPEPNHSSDVLQNTDLDELKIKWGSVPVVGKAKLGEDGYFDEEGYPPGFGDGCLRIQSDDPDAYGLRVYGDSMSPRIKHGEFVVIEPNQPPVRYEEVLVKTVDGRKMIKVFAGYAEGYYRFDSVNEDHKPIHLAAEDVEAIHYVAGILKKSRYFEQ